MISTLSPPHAAADAGALDVFQAWLCADLRARAVTQALVVSAVSPDQLPAVGALGSVTMHRRSPLDGAATDPKWGFADASFDAVYLHRMIRIASPATWLARARRVLKPGGTLLVVADPADFKFAPLPAGGDVLLLHRVLQEAGFGRTELVCRASRLIVVAALRDDLRQRDGRDALRSV
jgi:SAM-dependent methyltransferase